MPDTPQSQEISVLIGLLADYRATVAQQGQTILQLAAQITDLQAKLAQATEEAG